MAQSRRRGGREEETELGRLDPERLPRHIGMIMDGNGRWAQERHMPRALGHFRGATAVERIVRACRHLPEVLADFLGKEREPPSRISYVTLYSFSSENWRRPTDEVSSLLRLIESQLREKVRALQDEGIRVQSVGRTDQFPPSLREAIALGSQATATNTAMTLSLALSYGGRWELVDAARRIAKAALAGELDPDELDEQRFAQYLYAPELPDIDLLIRTGGEMRVSNFMLWQISYAELWVTPTLWPAFRPAELYRAIVEYQTRDRRFGSVAAESHA